MFFFQTLARGIKAVSVKAHFGLMKKHDLSRHWFNFYHHSKFLNDLNVKFCAAGLKSIPLIRFLAINKKCNSLLFIEVQFNESL